METKTSRRASRSREQTILTRFIGVFCRHRHDPPKGKLCLECKNLLAYAKDKLARCPYDPKPRCKRCPTHCYGRKQRLAIKEVMRYSGMYFVKRGRIDWLLRYFLLSSQLKRAGRNKRAEKAERRA